MSKNDAWMPLYVGDYLADTTMLTLEQSGAYLHLLMQYWRTGPLPDDDARLAAICRVSRTYFARHVGPAIRPFFTPADGRLHQRRADAERARTADISAKRSAAAGKKGKKTGGFSGKNIETSAQKTSENIPPVSNEINGPADANDQTKQGVLLDTVTVTDTKKEGRKEGSQEVSKRAPSPPALMLPDWLPRQPWSDFIEMRLKARKPVTDRAASLIVAKLDGFRLRGLSVADALNQSTEAGWQGVFEPRPDTRRPQAAGGSRLDWMRQEAAASRPAPAYEPPGYDIDIPFDLARTH